MLHISHYISIQIQTHIQLSLTSWSELVRDPTSQNGKLSKIELSSQKEIWKMKDYHKPLA